MEKSDIAVYLILFFAVIIGVYVVYGFINEPSNNQISNSQTNTQNPLQQKYSTISTGTTEPGDVSVDLTPIGIVNGQFQVDFEINTHSVDLSQFDLAKITILEYDGKKTSPINAPKLEGHHSSGTLTFNVAEDLNNFKITIKGIPKVEERTFEWK